MLRYEWIVVLVLFVIGGAMASADGPKEYRVVIPEETFIIVEFKQYSLLGAATMGLLKKVASGVLAIFPCSRTESTLCAQKWLRPCWTNFFEPPQGLK